MFTTLMAHRYVISATVAVTDDFLRKSWLLPVVKKDTFRAQ